MIIRSMKPVLLAGALALSVSGVHAGEGEFLKSLEGQWSGAGTVKVRTNANPIKVNCKFSSDTTDTSLSLDGNCSGLVIFSRAIKADLKSKGARYAGSYVGAGTGKAGLARQPLGRCDQSWHPLGQGGQRRPQGRHEG